MTSAELEQLTPLAYTCILIKGLKIEIAAILLLLLLLLQPIAVDGSLSLYLLAYTYPKA